MNSFILPEQNRDAMIDRIVQFMRTTLPGKRVEVRVQKYVRKRTLEQNAAEYYEKAKKAADKISNISSDLMNLPFQ